MSFFDRLKRLLGSAGASDSPSKNGGDGSATCKAITCMEAMAKVQEYLDGELDGVSHEEVAQHFSHCQRCYPHLKLEERFRELLHRSQEDEGCPESLKEQVLELLAAQAGEPE